MAKKKIVTDDNFIPFSQMDDLWGDFIGEEEKHEDMADTERKEIMLELFHLVCDILLSNPPTIQINSTEYPYELVKDQFMRLRMDHLEYVVESIRNRKGNKIGNIRSFLITALYNAPNTMTSNLFQDYIQSEGTPYRTRFEYFAEEKRKERDKKR